MEPQFSILLADEIAYLNHQLEALERAENPDEQQIKHVNFDIAFYQVLFDQIPAIEAELIKRKMKREAHENSK